jgi:outer membrane protein
VARATELFLRFAMTAVLCAAQNATTGPPEITNPDQGRHFEFARAPYQPRAVSALDTSNSSRIQDLMRAGNIYLSLHDAILLAIENSLDVQVARYQIPIAATDVQRARGGGTLRGVGAVASLPAPGVGGPLSPLVNAAAGGSTPATSVPANVYDLSFLQGSAQSISLDAASGSVPLPSAAGPTIPQFDPLISGSLGFTHMTTPQSSTLETGTNVLSGHSFTGSIQLTQGFSTGTQYSLQYNSSSQNSNTTNSSLNPQTGGSIGLTVTQPLLRGFGTAVNRRYITIARIDQKISQLVFRQQIINMIYGVSRLYYDLASLYEDLKVKQDTFTAARALYDNTKARVDEGTLAEVEQTRAEAQVAGAEQDLINSQGLVEQEEAILKRVLTRTIPRNSALAGAHIIPTDTLSVPPPEDLSTIKNTISDALAARPDVASAKLQIDGSKVALKGSRNALLPELDVFGTAMNSGLSGQMNANETSTGSTTIPPDPAQAGGFGAFLNQLASRRYPTYEVGIQLNFPLRNRVAQADAARDELALRASEARALIIQNQAELEAEDAMIALRRARSSYDAAARTLRLQQQSLDVEQARFDAGVSTAFMVILYQSYVAQARSTEVVARGNYFKALAALDRSLGSSIEKHNISMDDAFQGRQKP